MSLSGNSHGISHGNSWTSGNDWLEIMALVCIPSRDYNNPMNLVAVKFLRAFWEKHPDAEQPLKSWADEVKKASWKHPAEIKEQYRSASILKNRRVVFNIKGNDYRLVASVAYHFQAVYVKFIGTHKEYDGIDAETVEMEV